MVLLPVGLSGGALPRSDEAINAGDRPSSACGLGGGLPSGQPGGQDCAVAASQGQQRLWRCKEVVGSWMSDVVLCLTLQELILLECKCH